MRECRPPEPLLKVVEPIASHWVGRVLMAAIQLKIEHLVLDNDNPRITHADSQQQPHQAYP